MGQGNARSRSLGALRGALRGPAIVVAALVASVSAGCGSDGLSADGGNGPGGGDGGKNLQLFIGTWHTTSGMQTLTCAGQPQSSSVGDTIWQMGTTSDLMQPVDSSGCPFLANVSGNTATALPGQSCTQTMTGVTLKLTVTSYTFTVAASGTTATDQGSGNAVLTTGGTSLNCGFSESASYTKAP